MSSACPRLTCKAAGSLRRVPPSEPDSYGMLPDEMDRPSTFWERSPLCRVDPFEPNRVWFTIRTTGTHTVRALLLPLLLLLLPDAPVRSNAKRLLLQLWLVPSETYRNWRTAALPYLPTKRVRVSTPAGPLQVWSGHLRCHGSHHPGTPRVLQLHLQRGKLGVELESRYPCSCVCALLFAAA